MQVIELTAPDTTTEIGKLEARRQELEAQKADLRMRLGYYQHQIKARSAR